jgi:CspA family cold shock protein
MPGNAKASGCLAERANPRGSVRKERKMEQAEQQIREKGYGFIEPDDGSEDVFVHYTGIAGSGFRSLEESEKVTYEVARGRKGMLGLRPELERGPLQSAQAQRQEYEGDFWE